MRSLLLSALACASLLCVTPESAEAQVFVRSWRPWFRPGVVFMPPRPVIQVAAPPVYVQPYQQNYYAPPPPPVYMPPPPPVYIQQQPPVYIQQQPQVYIQQAPPPVYVQQPQQQVYMQPAPPPPAPVERVAYQAPVVVAAPALPQWGARFGFGGRFAGTINTDSFTDFSQLGFGGELLYRAHRRVVLEMAGEYQKRIDNGLARYDVPVTLGVRLHIGAPDWVVSPYLVMAAGAAYANLDFLHGHDVAWFVAGQLGGGLEIRLGKHFAITGDVRGDARHRLTKPDEATAATVSLNGKPFAPMADQYGAQFRLGAALYF
jgi:hypothetical protein